MDILIDLYLRSEDYKDTIFLIDEPELHINTSIQRNLILEIDKLIDDNCQLWITTHSIGIIRALQEDLKEKSQVVQFEKGEKYGQEVYNLRPIKRGSKKWREIFSVALDDLSELVSPKRIIYCEGTDKPGFGGQEKGLDAIVYNNIFADEYHDTLFISSGGNTELDQRSDIAIEILSKVFSTVEILVLKDRDMASGAETTEDDRQAYLRENSKNHRVIKRLEIENYLYDKQVLINYCMSLSLDFDELEYDKFVYDIYNQNLKDSTNKIKSICNIKGSVNKETFKKNLSRYVTANMDLYNELKGCIFLRK